VQLIIRESCGCSHRPVVGPSRAPVASSET